MVFDVGRVAVVVSVGLVLASGCKSTCLDDGFAWQQKEDCGAGDASQGGTDTAGTDTGGTATTGPSTSASATETMGSASATMGSATMSSATDATATATMGSASMTDATVTATIGSASMTDPTGGSGLWCVDADGDGFGDATMCMPAEPGQDPPPGYAPNDTDCDDSDPYTFPGSAPLDSPDACMRDADDDDWGDDSPPPGVVPGSDCDDADPAAFPGAAEAEDPDACMRDADEDGWGDTNVPPDVMRGSDCYDNNADLNPGDRVLYSVLDAGQIGEVDVVSGMVTPYAMVTPPQGQWSVITAAISPIDGLIYASNTAKQRIVTFDYCEGMVTELANHGRSICGLAYTPDGTLYAVDQSADELVVFDPMTGMVTDSKPLTVGGQDFDLNACGMSYDCVSTRLLVTDGQNSRVLSFDPQTGDGTVVADIPEGMWNSVGLEYDPVTKWVYTNNGTALYHVAVDGSNSYDPPVTLSTSLNDLAYGPTCK
ncbi:MAG TPA: hypothetical protein PKW35_01925 [Nannocystaceae bacterium]|nr:hypothetical protein [Nannocystaceae bacterium]